PRRRPAQARQGSGGRSVTTSANSPIRTPIMSRLALSLRLLPVALGLALLAGCGPTGPVRYEITGMGLYDGKPLDDGVIYFEPMDGQGSRDGAQITNGAYRIPPEKGLYVGKYKVSIIGGDGSTTSGKGEPLSGKPGFVPGKDRIPPEYNERSKEVKEVK